MTPNPAAELLTFAFEPAFTLGYLAVRNLSGATRPTSFVCIEGSIKASGSLGGVAARRSAGLGKVGTMGTAGFSRIGRSFFDVHSKQSSPTTPVFVEAQK